MTLFTEEGIVIAKDPMDYTDYIKSMFDAYQEWLRTQEFSRKAVENKIWLRKGCGGVMRVAPIGLDYSPDVMEWQEVSLMI